MHFVPIKIIKLNRIDWNGDKKPIIFSANHSNVYDFPVLGRAIKKHFFLLVDFTLINEPLVNMANKLNGCIYVDRKSNKSTKNAFTQCVEGVRNGNNMLIFPESTWNLTKSLPLLPRYWGDIKIAQATGSPIIPIFLIYCGRTCLIRFGERIYVSKNDSITVKDKEVSDAMVRLRKEIESSDEYIKHYTPMEYTDWIKKNVEGYKAFDVDYEMSCIRHDEILPIDEIEQIKAIGEEIHPVNRIKQKLKYARINYRYEEE